MRRRTSHIALLALAVGLGTAACGHAGKTGLGDGEGRLRGGTTLVVDPTLRGARLVPEAIDDEKPLGNEPGGGVRGIASGVRVVTLPSGAVLAAEDRLSQAPRSVTALPDRLGGGFLFVIGTTVLRADKWLGPARPIFVGTSDVTRLSIGLDRIYLGWSSGATQAIDAKSGAPLDAGPWPKGPHVEAYAAFDGWRAVAVVDLRGAIATFDAGATWTPLGLPMDARELRVTADAVQIGGQDAAHKASWFEVRPDGQVGRIAPPALPTPVDDRTASVDPLAKPFGKRPLLAAIEDGWPLADATAVVARDGELARIRIADGAIQELETGAFPLKPARCHPVPLGPRESGGFGFVCGEPRGRTGVYAFDARQGRLAEIRTFAAPRAVLSAGNGALAVRGGCGDDASSDERSTKEQSYCLFPLQGGSREVELRGAIGGERVAVLSDGRLAVVSPPHGDLGAARLTLLDRERATTRSIVFPPPSPEIARVLRSGMWLDGLWEKHPGVLGGWVESQGTMLGVEIDLDGSARAGSFVRDLGAVTVSQRYGLGWTASHHGYETTDGGATWTPLEGLPEPIVRARGHETSPVERGCGPLGCALQGWLRVGWGAKKEEPVTPPKTPPPPPRAVRPSLDLRCEPVRGAAAANSAFVMTPTLMHGDLMSPWGSFGRNAPLITLDWSPLYGSSAPSMRADELGMSSQVNQESEPTVSAGPIARVYAWGSKGTEWDHTSRWTVRWISPFGSSIDVYSSAVVPAPRLVTEASRFASGTALRAISTYAIAVADDPRHALLVAHRSAPTEAAPVVLEADRAPVEVRRADGEPFPDVESATRVAGHWFLATAQGPGELPATVLWTIEGGTARELSRVPRVGVDSRSVVRFARRSDGRAIGVVVDGPPSAERGQPERWVLGIDADSGATLEIESLDDADRGGHDTLAGCAGDEPGWIVDVPWTNSARVETGSAQSGPRALRGAHALLRVAHGQACVEQIAGSLDGAPESLARGGPRSSGPRESKRIDSSAFSARSRYLLRCVGK